MKRLPLPDLLKGFAVFLIVPVHILETFIDFPGRESLFGRILLFLGGPFAVPVFMMVMGYFVALNKKSFKVNFLRGIKIFILGFLLNIGLNFNLLLKIKFSGWQFNPLEYIFGVDIFYFAGLAIMVLSVLKLIEKNAAWTALFLVFLIAALTGLMNNLLYVPERNYIYPFIAGKWSWSYFPLFPWLAYPLAGFAFYHFEGKILNILKDSKILSGVILSGILILVLIFSKYGFSTTINLSEYYHHTFWFSFWVFGVVIIWAIFLRYLINKFPATFVGNFLMWLGKNITLFYVIQWLIIGNIATAIYQTQPIGSFMFWFAGIFIVTVLLTWLGERGITKSRYIISFV